MGHYDNCQEGNCPICGQKEGYCEHSSGSNLPEIYIPSSLRIEEKPIRKGKLMYGIGQEYKENEFGMWFGPNPSLNEMLEEPGRDKKSVIIRFNEDGTDEILYRWFEEETCWVLEEWMEKEDAN